MSELKISKQPGLLFAPMILMEHHKLVEKHAKDAGVPDLKAAWLTLMSGGANNDALLSGNLHIVTSGVTNMLLLWGKTNGDVKAIIGVSGLPFKLVTRNPNIKTIKDYGPTDRIAAADGAPVDPGHHARHRPAEGLRRRQGQREAAPQPGADGPPRRAAGAAQSRPRGDEPFRLLAVPGDRAQEPRHPRRAGIGDALGGDGHVALAYGTTKFYQENPKTVRAFLAAYEEAVGMIKGNPKAAAETYLSLVKERATVEEVARLLTQPGAIYQAAPVRTMVYAEYMAKAGFIKPMPKSWKEYFFPLLHDRNGS